MKQKNSLQAIASQLSASGIRTRIVTASTANAEYVKFWITLLASLKEATWFTQTAHWNVQDYNFSEAHAWFGTQYDELFKLQDVAAEQIKALDPDFVIPVDPSTLSDFSIIKLSRYGSPTTQAHGYFSHYREILDILSSHIIAMNLAAGQNNDVGGSNILGDISGFLTKQAWQVRAFTKHNPGVC